MPPVCSFNITPDAAAELGRQASFAGVPGSMHLDLVKDSCGEGWWHIRIRPGSLNGVPISRADGITLYVPIEQKSLLNCLCLNYFGDLSGGGFVITTPEGAEPCACGAGFRNLLANK